MDPATAAAYDAETRALIVRRVRTAAILALIPILASAALNPFVFETYLHERLLTHALQAGICLLAVGASFIKRIEARGEALALLLVCAINTSMFWSLSLSGQDMDVLVSLVCGVLLLVPAIYPWGPRVQTIVSVYSAVGYVAALPQPIVVGTRFYNVALSLVFAVSTSIVSAYVLDRHRRATFYERERVASLAQQRETLIDAGRLLNSTLALPELVGLVTDLGQRLTGAKSVALALLDSRPLAFRVVATASATWMSTNMDSPTFAERVEEMFCDLLLHDGLVVGPSAAPMPTIDGVTDGALSLYVAIQREEALLGMLVFGFDSGAATVIATGARLQIARGVAQMAAVALTNARLYEELQTASRIRSEFVSTISHELRTPLNVMLGYLEMVRDPDLPQEDKLQLLDRSQQNGFQLLELIESTLEIGRIDAGRDEVRWEQVQFAIFWRELGRDCSHLRKPESVALEWDSEVPRDLAVRTDPRKLTIIVRNLVGNALKFTEKGFVHAEASIERNALFIQIRDTGIGIKSEDQDAIFEKFRQADGSERRRFAGSGLGLYIVRRFAEQLGGTVIVSSRTGVGSTFTVRLPLAGAGSIADAA